MGSGPGRRSFRLAGSGHPLCRGADHPFSSRGSGAGAISGSRNPGHCRLQTTDTPMGAAVTVDRADAAIADDPERIGGAIGSQNAIQARWTVRSGLRCSRAPITRAASPRCCEDAPTLSQRCSTTESASENRRALPARGNRGSLPVRGGRRRRGQCL